MNIVLAPTGVGACLRTKCARRLSIIGVTNSLFPSWATRHQTNPKSSMRPLAPSSPEHGPPSRSKVLEFRLSRQPRFEAEATRRETGDLHVPTCWLRGAHRR